MEFRLRCLPPTDLKERRVVLPSHRPPNAVQRLPRSSGRASGPDLLRRRAAVHWAQYFYVGKKAEQITAEFAVYKKLAKFLDTAGMSSVQNYAKSILWNSPIYSRSNDQNSFAVLAREVARRANASNSSARGGADSTAGYRLGRGRLKAGKLFRGPCASGGRRRGIRDDLEAAKSRAFSNSIARASWSF